MLSAVLNGFARFFQDSLGAQAAALDVVSRDYREDGSIEWTITNFAAAHAQVTVRDAYTRNSVDRYLHHGESLEGELELEHVHSWYDLTITMAGDPTFKYRLAGHVESGRDSFSDPALGGLLSLKR